MAIKPNNVTWGEFFKKEFDKYNEKYKPRVKIKSDLLDLEIRNICAFTSAILEKGSLYLVSKKIWGQLYNIMKENDKHLVAELNKLNTMYWAGLGNFMDRENLIKLFEALSYKQKYIPLYVPNSGESEALREPVLDCEDLTNKNVTKSGEAVENKKIIKNKSVVVNKIRIKKDV
jgi:hypothetical protein